MSRLWRGFQRGRRRFRAWRRARPFWGGLFLLLAGGQLFLSSQLDLLHIDISFGPEGFLAILLPVVLLMCGILLWVTPQHRYFYSVIGTVTAIYSLLGLNLGGWFIGMLLGIIGGALGFAWTPVVAKPAGPEGDDDRPTAEQPTVEDQPTAEQPAVEDQPSAEQPAVEDQPGPDRQPRAYALLAVPLLLVAMLAVPAQPPVAAQLPCLLPFLCRDRDPDPTPDPELTPTPSPAPGPTGAPADPTAGPAPTPAPTDDPDADEEEPVEPSPSPTPEPTIPELDPPDGAPLVAAEPALMTADRLVQQRFLFEGITELPTANGSIRVLRFSFSRSTATNFALTTTADDPTRVTADPLVLSGDVTFYTSRFVGRLFGLIPLELTPDSPEVDLLELIGIPLPVFFTDVSLDLVFTSGAELTAQGFRLDA